jgi:hypothetical protein
MENALKFDFRVGFEMTADNVTKIIHAITIEQVAMAALPIASGIIWWILF